MFITNKLVYIQLQKTGCTHIANLLKAHVEGQQVGKHNAANEELLKSGRVFISSIRNPWDWYASLWFYGVQNQGGLKYRLTSPTDPKTGEQRDIENVLVWNSLYKDPTNTNNFRKWLKMILAPENSMFLGEKYGDTATPDLCGFMTYRYLKICCKDTEKLKDKTSLKTFQDLLEFEKNHRYIDMFIRQESLTGDFIRIVDPIHSLSNKAKEAIKLGKKSNVSSRAVSTNKLYDKECFELVAKRDSLICSLFSYKSLPER